MAKRFWPGYRWRILAHEKRTVSSKPDYTGEMYDRRSGQGPIAPTDGPTPRKYLEGTGIWEFDELCIDHWFHLEQMSDRDWWIGVGDPAEGSDYWHINVHIRGDGKVSVHVEKQ